MIESAKHLSVPAVVSELADLLAEDFAVLGSLGIAPDSGPQDFADPFGGETRREDWSNVGLHCAAVAWCAAALTIELQRRGKFSRQTRRETIRRALFHDALKPYEVFLSRAHAAGMVSKESYYSPAVFRCLEPVLAANGIAAGWIALLINDFGSESDDRICFKALLELGSDNSPRLSGHLDPWKLVHLADNMTYSTPPGRGDPALAYYLRTEDRIATAMSYLKGACKHAGLGISAGELIHIDEISEPPAGIAPLKSYMELRIWASHEISTLICRELDADTRDPDRYLRDLVWEYLEDPKSALAGL